MPSERHTRFKDTNKWEVKRQKNIYYANSIQKRAGVAIPVSDKIDLKTKFVPRDKKGGGHSNKRDNPSGIQNNDKHNAPYNRVPKT